jgi:CheY-like chemotaxis protein
MESKARSDEDLLKGLTILIVEDDPDTRELLKVLIQTSGGTAITTGSVPEALSQYDASPPHVIIADIGMPDYNGYTLIGRIRSRDRERGKIVPAIALTAYTTAIDRDTVLSAGFQIHIPKPFDPPHLVSVIADLAMKYKSNRQ